MDGIDLLQRFHEYFSDNKEKIDYDSGYFSLSLSKLSKMDPELCETILDNPEEAIKAAEMVLYELNDERNIQLLMTEIPKSQELKLREVSNQTGKLLIFEGYVMKPSEIYLKCTIAYFECSACGALTPRFMGGGDQWVEPKKCSACNAQKLREIEDKRIMLKYQRIELIEPSSEGEKRTVRPVKKKVYLPGVLCREELNSNFQPGKRVKVIGRLELEPIHSRTRRTNDFRVNILANNIIPIEQSWNAIKLTKTQKESCRELATDHDLLKDFAQSLAPAFESYQEVRESLILQHVGAHRQIDPDGQLTARGIINILLAGSPGTGKSILCHRSRIISPINYWTEGGGLSGVGLVACVVNDDISGYSLEVGPLVMADGGLIVIDEFNLMHKEDYSKMNNAMDKEQANITKANINHTVTTRTSVLANANPIHGRFTEENALRELTNIPKPILDRFNLVWAMREKVDEKSIQRKTMAQKRGLASVQPKYHVEKMRQYIAYARKLIPIYDDTAEDYFLEKYESLTGRKMSSSDGEERSHRIMGNILGLIDAVVKFKGVGKEDKLGQVTTTKQDIDYIFNMYQKNFELLGVLDKKGFVQYDSIEGVAKPEQVQGYKLVRNAIEEISNSYSGGLIPINDLFEKCLSKQEIKESEFDEYIDKLKRVGEIFEPRRGKVQKI